MRAIALLLLVSSTASALEADKAISQYRHRVWRAEDGLAELSIICMAQGDGGYLWLCTQGGLIRFDGVRFTQLDRRALPELDDNFITAVASASTGALFVGTRAGGVHVLKGGKLKRIGAVSGAVSWVRVGPDDTAWFGSYETGLWRLRGEQLTAFTTKDGLSSDRVSDVWAARNGDVWVATNAGLNRLRDGKITVYTTKDGLPTNYINSVGVARNGDVWASTNANGFVILHDGVFQRYGKREGFTDDPAGGGVEDRDGNVWLGMSSDGLYRIPHGLLKPLSPRDHLALPEVQSAFEDRQGNLWFGVVSDGLHRFSDTRLVDMGLSVKNVQSVLAAREGAIWLATAGDGVVRIDGERTTRIVEGLPGGMAFALHERRPGVLWIGVYGSGVRELRDGRVSLADTHGVEIATATAFADAPDGSLFVGTRGFGVFRVTDARTERLEGMPSKFVGAIRVAPDGAVWIGSNQGLRRWRDGKLETPAGIPGDASITALHVEADGTVLAGVRDGGLWLLGPDRAVHLTTRDGLCDDSIHQIFADGDALWMAARRGPFRLLRRDLERRPIACAFFGFDDEMRGRELAQDYQPTIARSSDGRLWLATTRGAVTIDPKRADARDPLAPPVAVEKLRVDRRAIALDTAGEVPPGLGELELEYSAISLTAPERVRFRYRLEGFDRDWIDAGTRRIAYYTNLPPGRYRFVVTACNHDGAWNQEGAALDIRLLPHSYQTKWFFGLCALALGLAAFGVYRGRVAQLRARARQLSRLVDEKTAELQRTQAQLAQSEKMSALGQLVAGVAHELNNPVNFITTNIDFLEERYRQLLALAEDPRVADRAKEIDLPFLKEDSPDLLRAFRHGAERIAAIVDNLQRFSRVGESTVKPTDLADGLRATLRMLEPMLKEGVSVQLDLEKLPPVECNPSLINQVFMNLLVNAAQAMKGRGEIRVSGRVDGDFAEIEVSDSGPGVPRELREKIFEPFFTTKDPGQGTGLGLSISYRIVSEHGGSLAVVDGEGGARFRLRLPLHAKRSAA